MNHCGLDAGAAASVTRLSELESKLRKIGGTLKGRPYRGRTLAMHKTIQIPRDFTFRPFGQRKEGREKPHMKAAAAQLDAARLLP